MRNNGNVKTQQIVAPGVNRTQTYSHDGVNRLTAASESGGSWSQSYGYDVYGNRWLTGGSFPIPNQQSHFNPSTNRIASTFGSVLYDNAGNVTRQPNGQETMSYDAESRMIGYADSGMGAHNRTYGYDGEGRRVLATASGKKTVFVYDAFGRLAAEYSESAPVSTGMLSYRTTDHLGSTRAVSDTTGAVKAYYDFRPFGERIGSGVGGRSALWSNDGGIKQLFTAKERDEESGLDDFGARYFGSSLGRFSSPDPLLSSGRPWEPQSWNRYAYGLNNPLRFIDPTGLYEWDTTLGGACTDKDLKGGNCASVTKAQGRDIVNQRKAIRRELKRLDKSKDASLRAVAGAIGAEGKGNGVTISMGPVTPGAAAQVSATLPLTLDANGNPQVDLRVLPGAKGDSLFIGLAHEGSHVWDAQNVAQGYRPFVRHLETEMSAYMETITAAKSLGWSSVGPVGGAPFWSSSWSAVDQQTRPRQEILKLLLTSPIYAPKNAKVAYTLGK